MNRICTTTTAASPSSGHPAANCHHHGGHIDETDPRAILDCLLQQVKEGAQAYDERNKTNENGPIKKQSSDMDKIKLEKPNKDKVKQQQTRSKPNRSSKTRRGGTRHQARQELCQDDKEEKVAVDITPDKQHIIPQSGWQRGGLVVASCDSSISSTDDDMPVQQHVQRRPKKKKTVINLRPHRSQDLYDAQRQDEELRALLIDNNATTTGLSIRQVHGKSLVFFEKTRIYIPKSLRQTTLTYYCNKYKYSHKQRLQESCYWPRMDRDYRREFQWKLQITDPTGQKEPQLVYDSDDYEFPTTIAARKAAVVLAP